MTPPHLLIMKDAPSNLRFEGASFMINFDRGELGDRGRG